METINRQQTDIQERILSASTCKELETIIDSIEPRQSNKEKTTFANHLTNVYWYENLHGDLEAQKEFALALCKEYNK
jgi:hypothetical protein